MICGLVFGGIYLYNKSVDEAYNNTITLIKNGSYEQALTKLENANSDVLSRKGFKKSIQRGNLRECYKNTVYLYAYAQARFEYDSENKKMADIDEYLKFIPSDYNGELKEEITVFKVSFKQEYDEYLAEKERAEEKYINSLKNKLPYEGMQKNIYPTQLLGLLISTKANM